jgi:uncharacterized protein
MLSSFPGGRSLVRVTVERVFPNCPRYVHRMAREEASPYVPREGCAAPEPSWKRDPRFSDALPTPPRPRDAAPNRELPTTLSAAARSEDDLVESK